MAKLKNLNSKITDNDQIIIDANGSKYNLLPFYLSPTLLSNERERLKYIKSIENCIRTSSVYRAYIKYLKEDIGLKKCMVFGELDDEKCVIEMHHGPIFTLFDYVEITLIYFIKNNLNMSSFAIAKQVLQDHTDNLIQVVMLSEMAHQAAHVTRDKVKSEFVDIESAWGDLEGYLLKYKDCIQLKHYQKINKYFNEYEKRKKERSDIFKGDVKNWRNKLKLNYSKEGVE